MHTRTGHFPIGFRRLTFSPWQKDPAALIQWATANRFTHIDLARDADTTARAFLDAGFTIGSADLPEWEALISPDAGRRRAAIDRNSAYIRACAALNIKNFFIVLLPEKPDAPRAENFAVMTDSLNALAPAFDSTNTHLVIEGWPGPGAQCCTPETVRAMIRECPSKNLGLNFDPSHLIRMHIDPLRFLEEFAARVFHVHAKDCELLTERIYDLGVEQPATFATPRDFGWLTWRYTIPGHGQFRWTRALEILHTHHYAGILSIELEDEHFNGNAEGEQHGLIVSAQYLQTC